jgi:hypothetical protein
MFTVDPKEFYQLTDLILPEESRYLYEADEGETNRDLLQSILNIYKTIILPGSETWFLALRDKSRWRISENKAEENVWV